MVRYRLRSAMARSIQANASSSLEDLEGDLAVVPFVVRQGDRGHASGSQLAFDLIAVRELSQETSHGGSDRLGFHRVTSAKIRCGTLLRERPNDGA